MYTSKWNNNDDTDLIIAEVLSAYLIEGKSHRQIQHEILGLPAPARGGGFETMRILHDYNIHGEKKAIFKNSKNFNDSDIDPRALIILKELSEFEEESDDYFENPHSINKNKLPTERDSILKIRVFQNKLRKLVLSDYSNKCALCEIDELDLLFCSHIIPWKRSEENRLDPRNAICLCVLHDRLFDKGYFTLDSNYKVIISKKASKTIINLLKSNQFRKPKNYIPHLEFLKYHAEEICSF